MAAPLIQVMDTTLRDGEQTPDVSYTPAEKLAARAAAARRGERRPDRDRVEARLRGRGRGGTRIAAWARKNGLADASRSSATRDGRTSVDWIVGTAAAP